MKSKLLMILAVLVVLFAAVSLSGCLGGDDDATNNTTNNSTNNTTPPAENNTTPSEGSNTTPPAESVTIVLGEEGPEPSYFVTAKDQKFSTSSLSVSKGETVRIMNTETRNFRHVYHSTDGAFEDFNLNPRYSATMTFNAAGTYKVELLNFYTNESFGDTAPVLTVTVA
ncbi:hypothetical protein LJC08_03610 [Methanimicrococcus sp. OttesenSCG-928-J09]|nr:hypothetical protein [Methanimicrococcus sp. OttesenSCG-928-J09]